MAAASTPGSATKATGRNKVRGDEESWKVAGKEMMRTKTTKPARAVKS